MEPMLLAAAALATLVALDAAALRRGRDSRRPNDPRRDWW